MNEFLWYIPNQVEARPSRRRRGRGPQQPRQADRAGEAALEDHGWGGALLGTGWGRPDTFTVATALAARTTTFQPLVAIRPGYWRPANFASAASDARPAERRPRAGQHRLGSGQPGGVRRQRGRPGQRYARTAEFMQLVRTLWTEEDVTFHGEHFSGDRLHRGCRGPSRAGDRRHPRLYFGGASEAAQRVAAAEADVSSSGASRSTACASGSRTARALSTELGREHAPLEFGLRITTLDPRHHRARPGPTPRPRSRRWPTAVRRARLRAAAYGRRPAAAARPGRARRRARRQPLHRARAQYGGGGAGTTWLVGSAEDVAKSLRKYQDLGITHFILSDTPYLRRDRAVRATSCCR